MRDNNSNCKITKGSLLNWACSPTLEKYLCLFLREKTPSMLAKSLTREAALNWNNKNQIHKEAWEKPGQHMVARCNYHEAWKKANVSLLLLESHLKEGWNSLFIRAGCEINVVMTETTLWIASRSWDEQMLPLWFSFFYLFLYGCQWFHFFDFHCWFCRQISILHTHMVWF